MGGAGFEPGSSLSAAGADSQQEADKPAQNQTLGEAAEITAEQKPALAEHSSSTSAHPEHVPSMYPPDLAQVVTAWGRLPDAVKAGILAMVAATQTATDRR